MLLIASIIVGLVGVLVIASAVGLWIYVKRPVEYPNKKYLDEQNPKKDNYPKVSDHTKYTTGPDRTPDPPNPINYDTPPQMPINEKPAAVGKKYRYIDGVASSEHILNEDSYKMYSEFEPFLGVCDEFGVCTAP